MRGALVAALVAGCTATHDPTAQGSQAVFGGAADITTEAVVMISNGPPDGPHDLCSAVVVAKRVAVTAAHCVADDTKSYRIQLGNSEKAMGPSTAVLSVHRYPRFRAPGDDQRAGFDLAVVLLAAEVAVTPIRIATEPDEVADGAAVDVIGFGQSDRIDLSSIGVRHKVRVTSRSVCDRLFGTGDETRGFCGGDSGGAVISTSGLLVGVIGFGLRPQCAPPGFATRIAPYARWIQSFLDGKGDVACSSTCPPESRCPATQPDSGTTPDAATAQNPPVEDSGWCDMARARRPAPAALLLAVFILLSRVAAARFSDKKPREQRDTGER